MDQLPTLGYEMLPPNCTNFCRGIFLPGYRPRVFFNNQKKNRMLFYPSWLNKFILHWVLAAVAFVANFRKKKSTDRSNSTLQIHMCLLTSVFGFPFPRRTSVGTSVANVNRCTVISIYPSHKTQPPKQTTVVNCGNTNRFKSTSSKSKFAWFF